MFTKLELVLINLTALLIYHQSECRFANNIIDSDENYYGNFFDNNIIDSNENYYGNNLNDEPPHTEYAKTARYIVHKSQYASMGTVSVLKEIEGFPNVHVMAIADSPKDGKSTGVIYFYLADISTTAEDLRKMNKLTILLSNDQDLACTNRGIDPMEPTCARVMISGKAVELDKNTEEYEFGNLSYISRHPAAKEWQKLHNFYMCKMEIQQIAVLNWYGGPHYVTPEEYYKADIDDYHFTMDTNKILNNERKLEFSDYSISNSNKINNPINVKKDRELRIKINKNSDIDVINIEV